MLDTLATSRALTEAGFDARQAEAITAAVRQAVDQGNHVTPEHLDLALEKLRAEFVTPEKLDLALEKLRVEFRKEFAELRAEMASNYVTPEKLDAALEKLRVEFRKEFAELRAEMAGNYVTPGKLDLAVEKLRTEIAEVRTEVARSEVRIVRWMFAAVGLSASPVAIILRLME